MGKSVNIGKYKVPVVCEKCGCEIPAMKTVGTVILGPGVFYKVCGNCVKDESND